MLAWENGFDIGIIKNESEELIQPFRLCQVFKRLHSGWHGVALSIFVLSANLKNLKLLNHSIPTCPFLSLIHLLFLCRLPPSSASCSISPLSSSSPFSLLMVSPLTRVGGYKADTTYVGLREGISEKNQTDFDTYLCITHWRENSIQIWKVDVTLICYLTKLNQFFYSSWPRRSHPGRPHLLRHSCLRAPAGCH